jgi:hypothetical protein
MLDRGERLLWWGQPPTGVILRSHDLFLIPFSVMWAGFAVFWEATAFLNDAPLFFLLWGIPFVAVGIYFVIGRFFHDAWRRSKTSYGITEQRIIIASPSETKMIDLASLGEIRFKESNDGTGSIVFVVAPSIYWQNNYGMRSENPAMPTFERIKEGKRVLSIIREAQRKVRAEI